MKISIAKQDLLSAVNVVKTVVSPKSALAILSHILFEADKDTLKLTATDLKVSVECIVDCTVEESGSLTVSSQRLSMILNELPDNEVTLELLDTSVVDLRCGLVETKLFSISPDEFPPVRSFEGVKPIVFRQAVIKNLCMKTSFAICTDQSRHNLTGLLFETRSDGLRVVATDGRRLSLAFSDEDIPKKSEIKVIVPAKMVKELESHLSDDPEKTVKVFLDESQAAFAFERIRLVTSLIEGTFPKYEAVIPKKQDKEFVVDRERFIGCVRRAYAMTNDKYRSMKMIFSDGEILMTVKTPEVGEYEEKLAVDYEGEKIEIAFNPLFILDVLRYIESENVCLQLKDGGSPGVIKPYTEAPLDSYINVVMPIRA